MIWRMVSGLIFVGIFSCSAIAQARCRKIEFDGVVSRGQEFSKPVSDVLTFRLRPQPGGWQIQVVAAGSRAQHDAAEIATPPYQSINPLVLTTDYGLRAQDVVAWNPRQFQFEADGSSLAALSADEATLLNSAAAAGAKALAEQRLIAATSRASHGELKILDASLVAGTADQAPSASAVASHWRTTPHTLLQPEKGRSATPLGEVESLKFRVTLWMLKSVPLAPEWRSATLVSCPQ